VFVGSLDEGIGVLSSLLLKKENYRSMVGGDAACMGCGEKTVIHLVVSAINALMHPRVRAYVGRLDDLITRLDQKARAILASDADLRALAPAAGAAVGIRGEEEEACPAPDHPPDLGPPVALHGGRACGSPPAPSRMRPMLVRVGQHHRTILSLRG
jgi:hypothetical protein